MFERIFSKVFITFLLATAASKRTLKPKASQLLVGYWGQNSAGPSFGPSRYEKPLSVFCKNSKFDIFIIAFIDMLFDPRNKNQYPGINLSNHCGYSPNPDYPFLFKCQKIEAAIEECQKAGKKVTMSLGGATGDGTLHSPQKAEYLANNLWQLFLGGKNASFAKLRPFGKAVLDGIDMDIEGGSNKYYPVLVQELHRLMSSDPSKEYLITGAPQCPYPDYHLGPVTPGSALQATGKYFNHIYVQFYNNYCWPGDKKSFDAVLDEWLKFATTVQPSGPRVFIGLPAGLHGAGQGFYYLPPSKLDAMYESVRNKPGIGGVMLWDCSWDQNNVIGNKTYSEFVYNILLRDNE